MHHIKCIQIAGSWYFMSYCPFCRAEVKKTTFLQIKDVQQKSFFDNSPQNDDLDEHPTSSHKACSSSSSWCQRATRRPASSRSSPWTWSRRPWGPREHDLGTRVDVVRFPRPTLRSAEVRRGTCLVLMMRTMMLIMGRSSTQFCFCLCTCTMATMSACLWPVGGISFSYCIMSS